MHRDIRHNGERHMPSQENKRDDKKPKPNKRKMLHGCKDFQAALNGTFQFGISISTFRPFRKLAS